MKIIPLARTALVVLPLEADYVQAYRDNPHLRTALSYTNGLKGLGEWCFHCGLDKHLFITGLSEDIFTKLDANDEDPRLEKFIRQKIETFFLSDFFYIFLENFFEAHSQLWKLYMGEMEFSDIELVDTKRSDVLALLLTP
jgi:hypothetical protein